MGRMIFRVFLFLFLAVTSCLFSAQESQACNKMRISAVREVDLLRYHLELYLQKVDDNSPYSETGINLIRDIRRAGQDSCIPHVSPSGTSQLVIAYIALKRGILSPENTTRHPNGDLSTHPEWNKDMDLAQAMQSACDWYFRCLAEEIGKSAMEEELRALGLSHTEEAAGAAGDAAAQEAPTPGEQSGARAHALLRFTVAEELRVIHRILWETPELSPQAAATLKKAIPYFSSSLSFRWRPLFYLPNTNDSEKTLCISGGFRYCDDTYIFVLRIRDKVNRSVETFIKDVVQNDLNYLLSYGAESYTKGGKKAQSSPQEDETEEEERQVTELRELSAFLAANPKDVQLQHLNELYEDYVLDKKDIKFMDFIPSFVWLMLDWEDDASIEQGKKIILELLEAGADIDSEMVDSPYIFSTAIAFATECGDYKLCQFLLENGANPELADRMDETCPLQIAASNGDPELTRLLLSYGASPFHYTRFAYTALHDAAVAKHYETCRLLIAAGSEATSGNRWDQTILHSVLDKLPTTYEDLPWLKKSFLTRLRDKIFAANDRNIMRLLLGAGAAPNCHNNIGNYIIHELVDRDDLTAWRILRDAGADVHLTDARGKTALRLASDTGKRNSALFLRRWLDATTTHPTRMFRLPLERDKEMAEELYDFALQQIDWDSSADESAHGIACCSQTNETGISDIEFTADDYNPGASMPLVIAYIALKRGIITPENTMRRQPEKHIGVKEWNMDMDLEQALRKSCTWYFRMLANEIGKTAMKEELRALRFSNADLSDWYGDWRDTIIPSCEKSFWLHSGLRASIADELRVLRLILGSDSALSPQANALLRNSLPVYEEGGLSARMLHHTYIINNIPRNTLIVGITEAEGKSYAFLCRYYGNDEYDRDATLESEGNKARSIAFHQLRRSIPLYAKAEMEDKKKGTPAPSPDELEELAEHKQAVARVQARLNQFPPRIDFDHRLIYNAEHKEHESYGSFAVQQIDLDHTFNEAAKHVLACQRVECTVYDPVTLRGRDTGYDSPQASIQLVLAYIALKRGIITPENTTRRRSRTEPFSVAAWNEDMDLAQAMRSSCTWYFRRLADEIGEQAMQEELRELNFGNADVSDWNGDLNVSSLPAALRGFWLGSSLWVPLSDEIRMIMHILGKDSQLTPQAAATLREALPVYEGYGERAQLLYHADCDEEGRVHGTNIIGLTQYDGKPFAFLFHMPSSIEDKEMREEEKEEKEEKKEEEEALSYEGMMSREEEIAHACKKALKALHLVFPLYKELDTP